jgi:hypothetical protein
MRSAVEENVVKFPKPNQRSWAEWEVVSRKLLAQADVAESGIDWIIEDLKPRYLSLIARTQCGVIAYSIDDEKQVELVKAIKASFELTAIELLYQLLILEVALYVAREGKPFPSKEGPGREWLKLAERPWKEESNAPA